MCQPVLRSHIIDTYTGILTVWHLFGQRASNVPGNDTYSGLVIKFPIFLPDFSQIWILSTVFNERPHCKISRTSDLWKPRRWMQTEMTNLTGTFRDCAKASLKQWLTTDKGWTSSFTVKSQYLTKFYTEHLTWTSILERPMPWKMDIFGTWNVSLLSECGLLCKR